MKAIILSVGDELVLGQTLDTNSQWLSQQLSSVGCAVSAHVTVGDDQRAIEQAIRDSIGRCNVLMISGGIGPTEDDLTRQVLAAVMNQPLELNESWLARLREFFEKRGRPMPQANTIQAMIPRGAKMIDNTAGTAAGIEALLPAVGATPVSPSPDRLTTGDAGVAPTRVFVMPGVPKEMMIMFARDVLPHVQKMADGGVILSRTLHTFGLGESSIAEKLSTLMRRDRNPSVGTTVSGGVVSVRVNARFASRDEAQTELDHVLAACREALGDLIYGEEDQTLADAVGDLLLKDPIALAWAPALATAESCTGGLLAKMLTDVPGSSSYFRQGYVTYSNEAKTDLLLVPAELIEKHGAVSQQVALAMAQGAQTQAGAAYALAITGIAGPTGGTHDKPVGTVWIALADPGGTRARHFNFPGDREMIRDRAAKMALTLLRFHLLGKEPPF